MGHDYGARAASSRPPAISTRDRTVVGIPFGSILELEQLASDGLAVYLSGSLAAGNGNSWSDIDVYVIGDRGPLGEFSLDVGTAAASQHYLEGRRIDYEFWTPNAVAELSSRLNGIRLAEEGTLSLGILSFFEQCFLHRLRIGVPIANSESFAAIQSRFDFERLRQYQVQETLRQLDATLEDLCGMMDAGDIDCGLFTARDAIGHAIDAYCHSLGNTDPSRKWRTKHLLAVTKPPEDHSQTVETFWQLQFPNRHEVMHDRQAGLDYLEQCVRFANRLASWIQR